MILQNAEFDLIFAERTVVDTWCSALFMALEPELAFADAVVRPLPTTKRHNAIRRSKRIREVKRYEKSQVEIDVQVIKNNLILPSTIVATQTYRNSTLADVRELIVNAYRIQPGITVCSRKRILMVTIRIEVISPANVA